MERWIDRVEVGNAYVNRHITGAIVRRQPFGGWKRSVVGPGAKAGGPNYVIQLGTWSSTTPPRLGIEPRQPVRELLSRFAGLDEDDRTWLRAAAASDAYWWDREFGRTRDESGLTVEANQFRYLSRPDVVLRVADDASLRDVLRSLAAAVTAGVPIDVSATRDRPDLVAAGVPVTVESDVALVERMPRWSRIRLVGSPGSDLRRSANQAEIDVIEVPVVASGRHELRWYLREQSISRTLHRFGNLVGV